MKSIVVTFLLCVITAHVFAQQNFSDSIAYKRNKLNEKNMVVLASWASSNIVYAAIAFPNNTGNEKYFHQMNIYWNVVNMGIAGFSYFNTKKQLKKQISFEQNVKEQRLIEKVLLINLGLDVAYMATGIYLMNRSNTQNLLDNQYQMKGFGQSLVLQGGFLLLFDVFQYLQHLKNGKSLKIISSKASIRFSPQSLTLNYKL